MVLLAASYRDPWPTPELRIPNAAAQTRIVSKARIRLDSGKSVRSFKGIICDDVSKFESCMPSQAVRSLCAIVRAAGATSHQNAPVDFESGPTNENPSDRREGFCCLYVGQLVFSLQQYALRSISLSLVAST